jgi:hypothetical protein
VRRSVRGADETLPLALLTHCDPSSAVAVAVAVNDDVNDYDYGLLNERH